MPSVHRQVSQVKVTQQTIKITVSGVNIDTLSVYKVPESLA